MASEQSPQTPSRTPARADTLGAMAASGNGSSMVMSSFIQVVESGDYSDDDSEAPRLSSGRVISSSTGSKDPPAATTTSDNKKGPHLVTKYELFHTLGTGSQGVVYKGQNCETKEPVAVKEIKLNQKSKRKRKSVTQSLRTEIAIMRRLSHPNLVNLMDVIEGDDCLYLVMEMVEGGPAMDDADILSDEPKPLTLELAQSYFRSLVEGLNYLHLHKVLHRDIKPSNTLVANDGTLKLADFGVSSFTDEGKSARVLGEDDLITVGACGTVPMLSPEALGAGPNHVYHGRPADVWAAGITLYTFVYGRLPFDPTDENLVDSIIEDPVVLPLMNARGERVPKEVRELLLKMLEKDPQKRITLSLVGEHSWVNLNIAERQASVFNFTEKDLQASVKPGRISKDDEKISLAKTIKRKLLNKTQTQELLSSRALLAKRRARAERREERWENFINKFMSCCGRGESEERRGNERENENSEEASKQEDNPSKSLKGRKHTSTPSVPIQTPSGSHSDVLDAVEEQKVALA